MSQQGRLGTWNLTGPASELSSGAASAPSESPAVLGASGRGASSRLRPKGASSCLADTLPLTGQELPTSLSPSEVSPIHL